MGGQLAVLAATDSVGTRLAVCAVASLVGGIFILAGRANIRNRVAEESGSRRTVNRLLGRSNTYEGSKAVAIGWMRVVLGLLAILFGIVFLFVGPFLAK